ncbi:DNA topoisomerase IB [Bradyrhizobium sp. LHD-71]|uniref:DNA topoisomerase IB n=1 Tax=Bradyrhizobium sp. LHD-71 TaxID=3072141 RepID=UPI00280EBEBD|nr:DNA topoisomerase IB [Bradyrhizobium sp. LHD-71]MDQ8729182.1 DNA topoisomerase IB [Bradyrhizobium sp. LHD-71]
MSIIVPESSVGSNSGLVRSRARSLAKLTKTHGLKICRRDELTIRRLRRGDRFSFVGANGRAIKSATTVSRLRSLAVPPAYEDVRYAADPNAHLQAVGRDAAGRLQYRYHPDWEKVRELRKARRLVRLISVLPRIRRSVAQRLARAEPTREFALAAVIELVASTAIRPGGETYATLHRSRGAATLLKSNVRTEPDRLVLSFRGKGGKSVQKECRAANLLRAVKVLVTLPGRRLFQYRDDGGEVRGVTSAQVNVFLREIAGVRISLKDFRTLMASAAVLESLAHCVPAASARARNRQVMEAVRDCAEELANTPAICRKSYVHETIVTAFEDGLLERFSARLKASRSQAKREQVLAQVIGLAASGS